MNYSMQDLLNIISILRNTHSGCDWDRKQNLNSLIKYTIEEVYELVDAIESNQTSAIKNELADLLYHLVFYAEILKEQTQFDFNDLIQFCCEKLIRRHPKQFSPEQPIDSKQTESEFWAKMKQKERNEQKKVSILADVPLAFPALIRADKIQHRVAEVGFDWKDPALVFAKVKEELEEVEDVLHQDPLDNIHLEEEIGDLLFSIVNLTRHYGFDAEQTLQKATQKFERRFKQVELKAFEQKKMMHDMELSELNELWQQIKKEETF